MKAAAGDWQALHRVLGEFAASGHAEVREDGAWLADLAAFQFELRTEGKDPVVHLWSEARNRRAESSAFANRPATTFWKSEIRPRQTRET